MHCFLTGIEIVSDVLTVDAISAALGIEPTGGGNRGDRGAGGRAWDRTVWRFDPPLPETATLDDRLGAIFDRFPAAAVAGLRALDPAAAVRLRVAAMHERFTCTVALASRWVRRAAALGLEIEVSTYPTGGDEAAADVGAGGR